MKHIGYAYASSDTAKRLGKSRVGTWYSCDVGHNGVESHHVAHESKEAAIVACVGHEVQL